MLPIFHFVDIFKNCSRYITVTTRNFVPASVSYLLVFPKCIKNIFLAHCGLSLSYRPNLDMQEALEDIIEQFNKNDSVKSGKADVLCKIDDF